VKDIYAHSGEPFNINSPQQLSRVLFEVLDSPPSRRPRQASQRTRRSWRHSPGAIPCPAGSSSTARSRS
jgi:hypothetical protein